MKAKQIHFSIDDVILSLKWLKDNKPTSLFESEFFKTLRRWNKRYGLQVDLYIYEMCNDFSLEELPQQYLNELKENTSWLKFCWHRRKAGPVEDDYDTEIQSFNRVRNIICNNISADAWTDTVRLHRFEADRKLIQYLYEYGDIKCLLCADDNRLSYDLDRCEMDSLVIRQAIYKQGMKYQKTDIRLDSIDEEGKLFQKNLLFKISEMISINPERRITIFFHEWKFDTIREYIDGFLANILAEREQTIYINSACLIQDDIYFTACNSNWLFRINMITKEIKAIHLIPGCQEGMKFAGLYHYNDMIWMIPWYAKSIYIFYINECRIEQLPIPKEVAQISESAQFRKSIIQGRYLWLLPCRFPGIIKIDMEKKIYKVINEWPSNVSFNKSKKMNFKMMFLYEDDLYLFKDACNVSIKLCTQSERMTEWKEGGSHSFGVISNNTLYVTPVREYEPIKIIKLGECQASGCINLPDRLWMNRQQYIYGYWYSEVLSDKIFFMPHEANGVLIIDAESKNVNIVEIDEHNYLTQRDHKNYSVYQVIAYKDQYILIPYQGNKIVLISGNGLVKKEYIMEAERIYFNQMSFENSQFDLQQYLEKIRHTNIKSRNWWIDNNMLSQGIGDSIHKRISEGMKYK